MPRSPLVNAKRDIRGAVVLVKSRDTDRLDWVPLALQGQEARYAGVFCDLPDAQDWSDGRGLTPSPGAAHLVARAHAPGNRRRRAPPRPATVLRLTLG